MSCVAKWAAPKAKPIPDPTRSRKANCTSGPSDGQPGPAFMVALASPERETR